MKNEQEEQRLSGLIRNCVWRLQTAELRLPVVRAEIAGIEARAAALVRESARIDPRATALVLPTHFVFVHRQTMALVNLNEQINAARIALNACIIERGVLEGDIAAFTLEVGALRRELARLPA